MLVWRRGGRSVGVGAAGQRDGGKRTACIAAVVGRDSTELRSGSAEARSRSRQLQNRCIAPTRQRGCRFAKECVFAESMNGRAAPSRRGVPGRRRRGGARGECCGDGTGIGISVSGFRKILSPRGSGARSCRSLSADTFLHFFVGKCRFNAQIDRLRVYRYTIDDDLMTGWSASQKCRPACTARRVQIRMGGIMDPPTGSARISRRARRGGGRGRGLWPHSQSRTHTARVCGFVDPAEPTRSRQRRRRRWRSRTRHAERGAKPHFRFQTAGAVKGGVTSDGD
jgi:hypothetical protein